MSLVYAVGIDLGTTNSAVAYVTDAGRTAMWPNELDEYTTPSCVFFDDEGIIVGRAARKARRFAPESVAWETKRDLGNPKGQLIRGREIPSAVIHGYLLQHLKQGLDQKLGHEYRVVITVPAFFDDVRRQSVADSAHLAGLQVLDIINEPTAAALAYAEGHGFLLPDDTAGPPKSLNVLVYDLGGGTFDVSVLQISELESRTLATDGDVRLGGSDWDQRLADFIAQKFEAKFRIEPRDDAMATTRLLFAAEEAKRSLSTRLKTTIRFEHQQHQLQLDLTREQFEILTADLLERTAHTTQATLSASGLIPDELDKVVLSGGSTRMPMVSQMLQRATGRLPDTSINPDECVARGAAIFAAHLLAEKGVSAPRHHWRFVDVNSHSLGIEGIDPVTGRRQNTVLIPRNTPLPAEALYKFVTKKTGQPTISIKVLEGESSDPDECILIGKTVMRNLPRELPQGTHVEVVYHYAANGRLTILVSVADSDRQMTVELQREGTMSDDRLRAWSGAIATSRGFPDIVKILEEVLGVDVRQQERRRPDSVDPHRHH